MISSISASPLFSVSFQSSTRKDSAEDSAASRTDSSTTNNSTSSTTTSTGKTLSKDEAQRVQELEKTDKNVKAHEAAHLAAAGGLAIGGASYQYTTGPDGKRYAVGGEVQISLAKGNTPAETIQIAEQVRRAALAPSDPSAQDQTVAAEAAQMATEARAQQAANNLQQSYQKSSASSGGTLVDTQA